MVDNSQQRRQIFLSYSRRDKEAANRLVEKLEAAGYPVWRDTDDIPAGDKWKQRIVEAIKQADALVLVLSHNSVQSDNVSTELGLAKGKARVIPVAIELVTDLSKLAYDLGDIQWVDLYTEPDAGFEKLLNALSERGEIPPPDAAPTASPPPSAAAYSKQGGLPTWAFIGAAIGVIVLIIVVLASAGALQGCTPVAQGPPTPTPSPTIGTPPPLPDRPRIEVSQVVDVYLGPDTGSQKAGQTNEGQTLDIIARNAETSWWRVCCVDGKPVWVMADLVEVEGSIADVPVATDTLTPVPPTLTFTPVPPTPVATEIPTLVPHSPTLTLTPAAPTQVPSMTPTSTYPPTPTIPELLHPEKGAARSVNEEIRFEWQGSLADDERYVFIIEHDNCPDPRGCSDVRWIQDSGRSYYVLPSGQWFLTESTFLEWKVVVAKADDPNANKEDKQPVNPIVTSERRKFSLTQ